MMVRSVVFVADRTISVAGFCGGMVEGEEERRRPTAAARRRQEHYGTSAGCVVADYVNR